MVTLDFRNLCTYSDFGRCSTAHRIIDANRQRVVASNRLTTPPILSNRPKNVSEERLLL